MKNVLISGGAGSFGKAMTKKLLALPDGPERIAIYSRNEHSQESMERELNDPRLRFMIGDVRDESRLTMAMRGIDTVFHAAALKIVTTAEYNPTECVETNVRGAENVIKAALHAGVTKVIALSTDKAVNPINLYGASKLCAEKIFIAANALAAGDCVFNVVRYGNVVGSRGSVVPLFKSLAERGEPLPITDLRMTRFWMTMEQATDFVLGAVYSQGDDGRRIYIPKIPSASMVDVAKAVKQGTDMSVIGIRPGEKLHETLLTEDESRTAVETEDKYIIHPEIVKSNLPEGFRYSSDTNPHYLSIEEIRDTI